MTMGEREFSPSASPEAQGLPCANRVYVYIQHTYRRLFLQDKIQQFSRNVTSHLWLNLLDKIAVPLKQALLVPQLYPTTFLLSADIFSYVMCLTVLPGLAVSHHAIKNAEIPFLFSLLAFPWMCFSLMTPRFGNSLYKQKFQWHTLGCISKGLALICKYTI